MKGRRLLLVLIFVVILAVGWLKVIRSVTGSEVMEKQNDLTAEADSFLERGLYVRALPLYEEALTYSSDLNPSIQEKLLGAFLEYGDTSSYVKLVERRISAGNAAEEEYITAADILIARSKLKDAMELIKKGMAVLNSAVLEDYFEAHRYVYNMKNTKYIDIIPTASNTIMPAYDGEKWGYVDEKGKMELDFIYDSALPFNEYGYAVVSIEGVYYTILRNGDRYAVDDGIEYSRMTDVVAINGTHILGQRDGTYSYFNYDFEPVAAGHQYQQITANACGVAAVKKESGWGIIEDSGKIVLEFTLEDVAVNSLGSVFAGDRAMVKDDGRWYLIDTQGVHVGENWYADAKAPESEGYIAVADENGRWGYINREGRLVIDYQYSDARSFSDGLGAVQIVNDWRYISVRNEVVIEEELTSAEPFHGGIAQVGFSDGMWLITLKYYEE